MPQVNYNHPSDLGLPGTWAELYGVQEAQSYALEDTLNTWTVTVAGTIAIGDEMSITVVDAENGVDETVSFVATAGTAANMAAGLNAALQANENLLPVIRATVAAGVVTIVAVDESQQLAVSAAIITSAAGTITAAETVAVTDIDEVLPGLAVVLSDATPTGNICRLPTTGDTPEDILGIAMRSESTITANTGEVLDVNGYRPGSVIPVARKGAVWVEPEGAVTAGARVFVRIVATGTERLGALRATDDGADAVELDNAEWLTDSRTVNGKTRAKVMINRPE